MKSRRRTQADVAKLAGESQAAVSQLLNCIDSTRPKETRQLVLDGKGGEKNQNSVMFFGRMSNLINTL